MMNQMSGRQHRLANEDRSSTDTICNRDNRIFSTGCAGKFTDEDRQPKIFLTNIWVAEEQLKMNDCYYEKKDWRVCKKEVSR